MMRLEYITPAEAADQTEGTEDKVFRMVEEGHLRLYARTQPHGLYENWSVAANWRSMYRDRLTGMQQIPIGLASELLSSTSGRIEVKEVILEGKYTVNLATDDNGMLPIIEKKDVYLRQKDIDNCINSTDLNQDPLGGHRTNALNALIGAVREFWLNPDPKHPATDDRVSKWVVENYGATKTKEGVSKTMGGYIAKIIRSEERRKGGAPKSSSE